MNKCQSHAELRSNIQKTKIYLVQGENLDALEHERTSSHSHARTRNIFLLHPCTLLEDHAIRSLRGRRLPKRLFLSHGKNQLWKEPAMERTSHGKNQPWKEPTMERTSHGKNQPWKEPAMERTSHGNNLVNLNKVMERTSKRYIKARCPHWKLGEISNLRLTWTYNSQGGTCRNLQRSAFAYLAASLAYVRCPVYSGPCPRTHFTWAAELKTSLALFSEWIRCLDSLPIK